MPHPLQSSLLVLTLASLGCAGGGAASAGGGGHDASGSAGSSMLSESGGAGAPAAAQGGGSSPTFPTDPSVTTPVTVDPGNVISDAPLSSDKPSFQAVTHPLKPNAVFGGHTAPLPTNA